MPAECVRGGRGGSSYAYSCECEVVHLLVRGHTHQHTKRMCKQSLSGPTINAEIKEHIIALPRGIVACFALVLREPDERKDRNIEGSKSQD
jgi:hypothetical protein